MAFSSTAGGGGGAGGLYGMSGNSLGNSSNDMFEQIAQLVKEEFENTSDENVAMQNVIDRLNVKHKSVVFFGFQGILANTFSLIDTTEQEEVKMRCFALDDSISPVFLSIVDFYKFHSKYNVPEGTINPVKFEDAMQTLRVGEKLNRKEQVFEDSEVDEFDDNCNDDCIPGGHTCGK